MSWSIHARGSKAEVAAQVEAHEEGDPGCTRAKGFILAEIETWPDGQDVDLHASGHGAADASRNASVLLRAATRDS